MRAETIIGIMMYALLGLGLLAAALSGKSDE